MICFVLLIVISSDYLKDIIVLSVGVKNVPRKCNRLSIEGFTPDACQCAEISNRGIVKCMLGSLIWKIKNRKVGWHCDWEKPSN